MAEEAQGQAAAPQPALAVPESMNIHEAADHLAAVMEREESGPARDPETGKFAPKKPPEEPQEAKAEEEAPPAEEAPAEEAPQEKRRFKLKYKGEELEKDEDEVVTLAQQGFDYTQKSQAIAKEREELAAKARSERESAMKQYEQQLAIHKKALSEIAGVKSMREIEELSKTNPVAAQQEFLRALSVNQAIAAIEGEETKIRTERQTEMQEAARKQAEESVEALQTKIPGWGNDLYGKVRQTAVKNYGFKETEVNAITDHRAIEVLHDAMKWRELKAAKPQTVDKKVAGVPKVIKPGTTEKTDQKAQKETGMRQQLHKSGNRNDAVSLVEELLSQGKL